MSEARFRSGERLRAADLNRVGYTTQGWLQYALTFPYAEPGPRVLPVAASRAGKLLGFDGAGGIATYNIASSVTDSILSTGSTTPRTVQNRFAERRNVKDFGAVGDGTTNDTAAIQAAIDAVTAVGGGGVVYFPPGRYKTNAALTVSQSCVTLCGDALGQNTVGTIIVGSGNHSLITSTATNFLTVENIGLAHPDGGLVSANSLIALTDCYYVTIRHVSGRFYWHGITLDGTNQVSIYDVELLNQQASSGTSWGIGLRDSATQATFGIKLYDVRLQGVNNNAGSVGLYGLGAATVYASQLVIRRYERAILCDVGNVTAAICTFWRLMQMEVELCTNGVDIAALTRFTAVGCQVALSTTGYGWRFASANVGDVSLIGCVAVNNATHGFELNDVATSGSFVFEGCKASGNSVTASNTSDGLLINNTSNVTVTGGRYGGSGAASTPTTATQRNGIRVQNAATVNINITGANLQGNNVAFVNGATEVPQIVNCRGFDDTFVQVRATTDVNRITITSVATTFSPLIQASGSDTNINLRMSPKGTGAVVLGGPVSLAVYTVATLPAAGGSNLNAMIMVSDESGGRVPAFSDGTNWRRVTDRAVVS